MVRPFRILRAIVALIVVATGLGLSTARAQAPGTFFVSDERDGSVKQFTNTFGTGYSGKDLGPAGSFNHPRGLALQNIPGSNPATARLWAADLLPNATGSQIFTYGGGSWTGVHVPNQSSLEYVNAIAFNNTGNTLFVASHPGASDNGAGNVFEYVANGTSLTLEHIFTGSVGGLISNPTGMYFSPTGAAGTLFVTSSGVSGNSGSIVAIDVKTNAETTVASGLSSAAGPGGVYYRTDSINGGHTYVDVANAFASNSFSIVEYTLSGTGAGTHRTVISGLAQAVDPFYSDGNNLYVTGFGGSIYSVPLTNPAFAALSLSVGGSRYTDGEYSYAVALPGGVSLQGGVPEPTSYALLGLGLAGLVGYRRARSRQVAA